MRSASPKSGKWRADLLRAAVLTLLLTLSVLAGLYLGLISADWIRRSWPLWAIALVGIPLALLQCGWLVWPRWPRYRESAGEMSGADEERTAS